VFCRQVKEKTIVILFFILLSLIAGPASAGSSVLDLPLKCTLGETKGARDFRGAMATYDGHNGPNFRITSSIAMHHGVNVLALAPGWVEAICNSVADRFFLQTDYDFAKAKGIECGVAFLTYITYRDDNTVGRMCF